MHSANNNCRGTHSSKLNYGKKDNPKFHSRNKTKKRTHELATVVWDNAAQAQKVVNYYREKKDANNLVGLILKNNNMKSQIEFLALKNLFRVIATQQLSDQVDNFKKDGKVKKYQRSYENLDQKEKKQSLENQVKKINKINAAPTVKQHISQSQEQSSGFKHYNNLPKKSTTKKCRSFFEIIELNKRLNDKYNKMTDKGNKFKKNKQFENETSWH